MTWCDMHPVNISLQRGSSPTKRRSGRGGTRRRTLAAAALAALALTACGTTSSDASALTAGTTTTPPTTPTQLDYEHPDVPTMALDLARSMCQALNTATTGVQTDNAPNDSPATDAYTSGVLVDLGLDQVMAAELDDDVTAVIMTTGADHLCPQHSARVARYLATR